MRRLMLHSPVSFNHSGFNRSCQRAVSFEALRVGADAHHYRIIGFEVTRSDPDEPLGEPLVEIGHRSIADASQLPHHIELLHLDVHGPAQDGPSIGLWMVASDVKVMSSRITDIRSSSAASSRVLDINGGAGNVALLNNEIHGGGNLLSIIADVPPHGLIPDQVTVAYNTLTRTPAWVPGDPDDNPPRFDMRGDMLVWIGGATSLVFEGNLIERALQAPAIYARANYGPITDLRLGNNLVRRASGGLFMRSDQGFATSNVKIGNNIFAELDFWYSANERTVQAYGAVADVAADHNTFVNDDTSEFLFMQGAPVTGWLLTNSIAYHGQYGITGGVFPGTADGNVLVGSNASTFPGNNCFQSDDAFFADKAAGDYTLPNGAPCGMTTDGTDPGVDFAAFDAVAACRDAATPW